MSSRIPTEIIEAFSNFVAALAPSAIGATIAVALKRGMTWTERLIEILIGICVSWYVRIGFESLFDVGPFMGQAIGFTAGLLAYDALPRFRERAIALLGEAPDMLRDWLTRRKGGK